ncbi:MAG: NAD+ synthase [Chloroflexi bacterium]|nr:NAD+ synthase [Chloroflexota bacterium]MCI0580948.1 NAD+ synthase [Chloroflexota bacterium]MCI0645036.1 NAD+ synthase [Chloroflexota bacterium]MCI0725611.1 NAD+ synthase [Chloroflexota bacterium]
MDTNKRNALYIDTQVASLILTRFLHNEITKAGFQRAVLGLSGGIDSALSCYLAAAALGPENVLALRLPYRTSSPESQEHAQLVIEELGVQSDTVDITPVVEPLFEVSPDINPNRKGNIMARMRMIILYDRSTAWRGLVVGTSNKTELLLGYGTIFGDLASAINPIGDLYKTQVRQLAKALGVPQVIIEKAPTADLVPGQTDEGDLGFPYERVDQLLYLLVDERYTPEEAVAAGFSSDFVQKVMDIVRRAHYKRTLPVIPKLSGRTIGHDFRYLRDWGT